MERWVALTIALCSCGRTEPRQPGTPAPGPVACAPAFGNLGFARYPIVSSIVGSGDDLFVSSHERFIPMAYRTPGAVEQLSGCAPGLATSVLAGEDQPGTLQASAAWVHWITADHDAAGENLGFIVRSRSRTSAKLISRRLDPLSRTIAGPALSPDGLLWVIQGRSNVALHSGLEAQDSFMIWLGLVSSDTVGSELYPAGDRRVWVARSSSEATVTVFTATGLITLWKTRYDLVVLGVDNGYLYYQEYDVGTARNQVLRRALDPAAASEVVFIPMGRALRGAVGGGDLFVVENERLVRITLATGLTRILWSSTSPDEEVTALTVDRTRLIYAVGNLYGGGARASVWAVDLTAGN